MDIGSVNHEVAFCKVYDMATKEKVERILLKNRISYYVEWEDKGLGDCFCSGSRRIRLPAYSGFTVMKWQGPKSF